MRNQVGGRCYRCGEWVKPGDGHVERVEEAQARKWPGATLPKWLVQHALCATKYTRTPRHYLFRPDVLPWDGYDQNVQAAHAGEREEARSNMKRVD